MRKFLASVVAIGAVACASDPPPPVVYAPPPPAIVAPPIDPMITAPPPPEGRRRTAYMRTDVGDQEMVPAGVPNDVLLDEVVLLKDKPCFLVTIRSAVSEDQPLSQWSAKLNGRRFYFEQENAQRASVPYQETATQKGVVKIGPGGVAADVQGVQVTTGWAKPVSRQQVSYKQFEIVTRTSEYCPSPLPRNAVIELSLPRPQRQPAWAESFEFSKD